MEGFKLDKSAMLWSFLLYFMIVGVLTLGIPFYVTLTQVSWFAQRNVQEKTLVSGIMFLSSI